MSTAEELIRIIEGDDDCEFQNDELQLHSQLLKAGTGDHGQQCCRLCGGYSYLKRIRSSYLWEGVEETYEALIRDCFRVKATHVDCYICEDCIKKLWETRKLKSLVFAAFGRSPSECKIGAAVISDNQKRSKTKKPVRRELNKHTADVNKTGTTEKPLVTPCRVPAKVDVTTLTNVSYFDSVVDEPRKSAKGPALKRIHVSCEVCRHTYSLLCRYSHDNFVCSRCKRQMVDTAERPTKGMVLSAKPVKRVNQTPLHKKRSIALPKRKRAEEDYVIYVPMKGVPSPL